MPSNNTKTHEDEDENAVEEMELPPGIIADSSIGEITTASVLQVDNFVDDESSCSPMRRMEHDRIDEVEDDEEDVYIPSFGSPPLAVTNTVDDTNNDISSGNYSLEEMCELLKQDSDSDSDVESITDESRPVHLHIPIQRMNVSDVCTCMVCPIYF